MPLRRNRGGGRNVVVPEEGFRALAKCQRQVQALQEELRWGIEPRRGDESENETENEEQFEEE